MSEFFDVCSLPRQWEEEMKLEEEKEEKHQHDQEHIFDYTKEDKHQKSPEKLKQ